MILSLPLALQSPVPAYKDRGQQCNAMIKLLATAFLLIGAITPSDSKIGVQQPRFPSMVVILWLGKNKFSSTGSTKALVVI